jgi:PAS domain S-box-containing protein
MGHSKEQPASDSLAGNLLPLIVDRLSTGICVWEIDGQIKLINVGLCRMLGHEESTEPFRTHSDMILPDDLEVVKGNMTRLLEGETDVLSSRVRLVGCSSPFLWTSMTLFLEKTVAGGNPCFIAEIKDISQLIALENRQQREQISSAISSLAGGITHGFNNILSSILGNADFAMRHELAEEDPGYYSVQQIMKAGHRASSLVRQVLTLSRWKEPEQSQINLSPIIKEAVRFLKATTPADIEIRLLLQASSDLVVADPVTIHQILTTLCVRAIDLMAVDGGLLEVRLEDAEPMPGVTYEAAGCVLSGAVRLWICDSGQRMTEETRERIFDPESSSGIEGNLAVVQNMVEEMKGEIQVSDEPDRGTCFSVILPVFEESSRKPETSIEGLEGGRERILFVDDDEQIVEFMERSFEMLGYKIVGRTSSEEACELFCGSPDSFDILISDMNMEGMTGDKLAEKVLAVRPDLPVIICTGYSEMMTRERAQEVGIKAVIMKPFMMDEMDELIRKVLGK